MDFIVEKGIVGLFLVLLLGLIFTVRGIVKKIEKKQTKDLWGMPPKNKSKKENRFDGK